MKKRHLLSLAVIPLLFISCDKEDTTSNENIFFDGITLQGAVTRDATIPSGSYLLKGEVSIEDGVTLTIEAGTTFTAKNEDGLDLFIVKQGGKVIANGTASNPIVFTATVQEKGQWGGITIAGKAPVNFGIGEGDNFEPIVPATAEVRNIPYGGTAEADNSGILNYVRVEYGGEQLTPESEFNSFSFYGVGSGTTLTNLQSYNGKDDGFEFFGGTVNASNLVAIGSGDDSIDWTEGWTGTVSNIYIVLDPNSDSGFEGDNNGLNNNATPVSNPQLRNITIIGADGVGEGINLREGTNVSIDNLYITGFDNATSEQDYIEVDSQNSIAYVNDGSFRLTNINFNNPGSGTKIDFPSNDPSASDYVMNSLEDITFDMEISITGLEGFSESDSMGAGNGAIAPDWTTTWTIGL